MFKSVFLHVGPHKTGSSYIQKFLFENRKQLENSGFIYPDLSNQMGEGHHEIAKPGFIETESKAYFQNLSNKYLGKDMSLILSAENFIRLDEDHYNLLKDNLCCEDIKVVFFVRLPSAVLKSLWSERIKHGNLDSQHEFYLPHFHDPYSSQILNPMIYYNKLINVFDNVMCIDYESSKESHTHGLAKVFESLTGIRSELKYPDNEINKSIGLGESEIYRLCRLFFNRKFNKNIKFKLKDFQKEKLFSLSLRKKIRKLEKQTYKLIYSNTNIYQPYKEFMENETIKFFNKASDKREDSEHYFEIVPEGFIDFSEITLRFKP